MREMRSHTPSPVTTRPLASSDRPWVTTETTIAWPCGERSSASLTQLWSAAWSTSAPASKVACRSAFT